MIPSERLTPYRGIQAFRYVDREYYFGREELIHQLTSKVLLYRLVVLFGESGVGKSSLLNAGLIGALRQKGFQPERLRVRPFESEPITIERVAAERGDERKFLPSVFADDASLDPVTQPHVYCSLEHVQARVENQMDTRVVLIFDQFEELFTLFSQTDTSTTGQLESTQRRLLNMIVAIVGNPQLKVKVIIAIREDYLSRLDILARNYPQVFDNRVLLSQLDEKEAGRAILCPVRSPHHFESRLTTKLAVTIIREFSKSSARVQIHPTQLQIVCRRLWTSFAESLPVIGTAQFRQMGGTKGIIEGFLSSELGEITSSLRPAVLGVLSNLITESGTRDVVSRRKLADLASTQVKKADFDNALRVLEDRRLINSIQERGTTFYELSNEFLIGPIQKELEQHLIQGEREQARSKVVKNATRLAAFALLILVIAFFVGYERYRNQQRLQETAEAKKIADAESSKNSETRILINTLSDLASQEVERRSTARTNIMQLAEQKQIPAALLPVIAEVVNSKDKDLAERYLQSLYQVVLKTSPPPIVATSNPVRVFIQISDEQQRNQAILIKSGLDRAGVTVLGIQRVSQGPKNSELRYFIVGDEDAANDTASKIKQLGVPIRPVYVVGYQNSSFAQSGQFELWFAALPQPSPEPSPQPSPELPVSSTPSPSPSPSPRPIVPGWYIVISLNKPTLYQRLLLYNVLQPIAVRDGVRLRVQPYDVKLGPYATFENAATSRPIVIESMKLVPRNSFDQPSVLYIGNP
jgi:hypothetical protein